MTQGYTQVSRIDFDETFTHVIKQSTIRVIIYCNYKQLPFRQLDVKKAFYMVF